MSDNPYASVPVVETSTHSALASDSVMKIARAVFLDWEKLRPAFIGILAVPTLAMIGLSSERPVELFLLVGFGAVVANVCYMAGPIVETYIRWLGLRSMWPRFAMFASGTLLTMLAAIVSLGFFLKFF